MKERSDASLVVAVAAGCWWIEGTGLVIWTDERSLYHLWPINERFVLYPIEDSTLTELTRCETNLDWIVWLHTSPLGSQAFHTVLEATVAVDEYIKQQSSPALR